MKIFYQAVLHITNLFFLAVLGVLTLGSASNPSAYDGPSPGGLFFSHVLFLIFLCFANYIFQIRKGGWKTLLIGHAIYIAGFFITLFVVYPFLYEKFYISKLAF